MLNFNRGDKRLTAEEKKDLRIMYEAHFYDAIIKYDLCISAKEIDKELFNTTSLQVIMKYSSHMALIGRIAERKQHIEMQKKMRIFRSTYYKIKATVNRDRWTEIKETMRDTRAKRVKELRCRI